MITGKWFILFSPFQSMFQSRNSFHVYFNYNIAEMNLKMLMFKHWLKYLILYMYFLVFPKTLYFSHFMNFDDYYTCCYLAFSLFFSTHKYILTGDFSWLGLNRIITSGVILFIGINEDYIES